MSLKPVDVNTTASLGKSDAGEYQVSKSREERGGKIEVVFFVLCADKGRSFIEILFPGTSFVSLEIGRLVVT